MIFKLQSSTHFLLLQIAAQRADQSPMPAGTPKEERQMELVISTTDSDTGERTITDYVQIPKSSIVEYVLRPGVNTERILIVVSIKAIIHQNNLFRTWRSSEKE